MTTFQLGSSYTSSSLHQQLLCICPVLRLHKSTVCTPIHMHLHNYGGLLASSTNVNRTLSLSSLSRQIATKTVLQPGSQGVREQTKE